MAPQTSEATIPRGEYSPRSEPGKIRGIVAEKKPVHRAGATTEPREGGGRGEKRATLPVSRRSRPRVVANVKARSEMVEKFKTTRHRGYKKMFLLFLFN